MDLRVYDFSTGTVKFNRTPAYINKEEQLAQYIAKLLIQAPESNIYSPEGGEGIFNMEADLFIASKMIAQHMAEYIYEQDEGSPQLSDAVKLGKLDDIHVDYKNGMRRINIVIYNTEQASSSATIQEI